ncbi:unnamed protein product [Somion occarium]|uniref:Uncharacterized protein n=1 Tax=Somion occarium TaxID=3059160 RepID=A0ABP1CMI6_9APHY
MDRRRFAFSLADDSYTENLKSSMSQIIFTLTPVGLAEQLFNTAHPIAWHVFDFRSEYVELECHLDLAVCTVQKRSDSCIEPIISRIVPRGHYTALITQGSMSLWQGTCRWHEDEPTSILIHNDSKAPQAFSICATMVKQETWAPVLFPIILFNKLEHDSMLRIKSSLCLQAYYGSNFRSRKQIHVKDGLQPVLDESGKVWSVVLDDQPMTSSWQIRQMPSGRIQIERSEDEEADRAGRQVRKELKQLRAQLEEIQKQAKQDVNANSPGLRKLKTRIAEIEEQMDAIQSSLSGTGVKLKLTDDTLETWEEDMIAIKAKVRQCLADLEGLKSSRLPGRSSTSRGEDVSSDQLNQLRKNLERIEDTLKSVGDSVQTIPGMQTSIAHLGENSNQAFEGLETLNRVVTVVAANTQETIAAADQRIVRMGARLKGVEEDSRTHHGKLQKLEMESARMGERIADANQRLETKAAKANVNALEADFGSFTQKLTEVDSASVGLQDTTKDLSIRIDGVDRTVGGIEGKVKAYVASLKLGQEIENVSKRVQDIDRSVLKLEADGPVLENKMNAISTQTERDIENLREELGKVDALARGADQRSNDLTGDTNKVRTLAAAIDGRVESLHDEVERLDRKVGTADNGLRELKREVKEIGSTKNVRI